MDTNVKEYKNITIEHALEDIVARNGCVTPAMVVQEAQSPDHPLHDMFIWDDAEAAIKFRTAQARLMIISTKFVTFLNSERSAAAPTNIADTIKVRRFLPSTEGFKTRDIILSAQKTRFSIVEKKKKVLREWCNSVIDIEELKTLVDVIKANL